MENILVVCIGNVCRSPVAEAMLKRELPDKHIWSAGMGALVGQPAQPLAQEIAAEHDLDISAHRAQQLSGWMCTQAELILVMEAEHRRELQRLYPSAHGKIRCLGETGPNQQFDIQDPYRRSRDAFETAHAAIERGVAHWVQRIRLLG